MFPVVLQTKRNCFRICGEEKTFCNLTLKKNRKIKMSFFDKQIHPPPYFLLQKQKMFDKILQNET